MLDFRKDLFADERDDNLNEIGQPTQRQDALGHVTGRSPYFDDHLFDGMLHLKVVRSPHHHARIRSIDTSAAERAPGVHRILRGADVPINLNTLLSLLNFGLDDEPSLAVDKVRYKGEPVVAVVAESEAAAYDAVKLVRVDYEELPAIFDVEEAIKPGAVTVNDVYPTNKFIYHEKYDHQKIRFGDVEAGFAQADHVHEARYSMSPIEHAPVEPNGAIAVPETNDRVRVHTATQGLFFSLGTAAKILDMPSNKLHFIGGTVGGGFGGKVDSLCEPLAILACKLTGRPVRYCLNRAEEMQDGPPRGAEIMYIKDGVMNDGRLVARKITNYFDAGAYTRLSSYAVVKCAGHLPGPYTIPNVSSNTYCVYTNRTPSTAMRGFGITAIDYAIEVHMDKMAHLIGMDPMEFRILNAYRDGDMKAHRREAKNCALIECVQVVADKVSWPIRPEFKQMSSMRDGGGERAAIPHTVTDTEGAVDGVPTPQPVAATPQYTPPPTPAPAQPQYTPPPPPPAAAPQQQYTPPPPQAAPSQQQYAPQPPPPPPSAPAAPAEPPARERSTRPGFARHGANRFSSVTGRRR